MLCFPIIWLKESNGLYGAIPTELRGLSNLEGLSLRGNSFLGTLPFETLSKLSKLTSLDLSQNVFHGKYPELLTPSQSLPKLKSLSLGGNRISGTFPWEHFWSGTNQDSGRLLEHLDISQNGFSGTLPDDLGLHYASSLRHFNASYNFFRSTIPDSYGELTKLEVLELSSNGLTGTLPSRFGNMESLQVLGLFDNALKGPLPPELGSCSMLSELYLNDNDFTGSLPAEFAGMLLLSK